jgi:Zn-dependent protease
MAEFLLLLPVLLFSVVAHEYAHAWTAFRQGDDTAFLQGRLTLNPVSHLDPVMSLAVPVLLWWGTNGAFTFGAARPVPVNPAKFRRFVRGDLIVSSAGIVMNLVLALAAAVVFLLIGLAGQAPAVAGIAATLQRMALFGIYINLLLACFNLVPLPPLDGSHLLFHALPRGWRAGYQRFGRYGFLVLVLSLWMLPGVWTVLLWPADALADAARQALAPWALGTAR